MGERVTFFRGLGRAYGPAGRVALTIALTSGAVLASTYRWDGQLTASPVVAADLVAVAGVAQARRMTRLRQGALRDTCVALMVADGEAYGSVMAAYQLPKDTEELRAARSAAIAGALVTPAAPPAAVIAGRSSQLYGLATPDGPAA